MGFDGALQMETSGPGGWSETQLDRVRAMGLEVRGEDSLPAFALVQALLYEAEAGEWVAVSEPDGEGAASGSVGH